TYVAEIDEQPIQLALKHIERGRELAPPGARSHDQFPFAGGDRRAAKSRRRFDLDPPRLDALGLGQVEPEHAVLQLGRDPAALDLIAQDERPVEVAGAVFLMNRTSVVRDRRLNAGV